MKIIYKKFTRILVCTLLSILLCTGFIAAPQAKALAAPSNSEVQSNTTSLNTTSTNNKHYTDVSVVPLEQQLKETDGITKIVPAKDESCKEGYFFQIEQPLDWNNPNGDKFNQWVYLRFNSQSGINIYECGGYTVLYAANAPVYFGNEHNENYISIEYRFFNGSRPEGLTNTDTSADTWQNYCTSWQMANDIHNIYQKLNTILSGKSALFGISKGGYVTNYQAYFQDTYNINDFDAFYPFCAPFCDGINDNSMFNFIQNEIGNNWYGESKATKYRDIIFNYEMECYKYKPELSEKIDAAIFPEGKESSINTSFYTDLPATRRAKLFDFAIANYAESIWQQYEDETIFEKLQAAIDMPEGTDEQKTAKINALYQLCEPSFTDAGALTFYWDDTLLSPYFIQAYTFMGENTYSYTSLREAIAKQTWFDTDHQVTITENEEGGLATKASVQQSLRDKLTYSSEERNNILAWNNNCKQNIFRVYGALDPWYATRIPDVTSNGSIKTYVAPGMGHAAQLKDLTEEDRADFKANYEALLCNSMEDVEVALEGTSYTFTGSAITPAVSVNMNGVIVSPDSYTVEYLNNVDVGIATVRITGTKSFSGTVKKTFTINATTSEEVTPTSTSSTADHSTNLVWPILAMLAISGVSTTIAARRKGAIQLRSDSLR